MRYALIHNGLVVNVILWDGVAAYEPPSGYQVIASDVAEIGSTYSAGVFTPPVLPQLEVAQTQPTTTGSQEL